MFAAPDLKDPWPPLASCVLQTTLGLAVYAPISFIVVVGGRAGKEGAGGVYMARSAILLIVSRYCCLSSLIADKALSIIYGARWNH